jgi:hypothetical protein
MDYAVHAFGGCKQIGQTHQISTHDFNAWFILQMRDRIHRSKREVI